MSGVFQDLVICVANCSFTKKLKDQLVQNIATDGGCCVENITEKVDFIVCSATDSSDLVAQAKKHGVAGRTQDWVKASIVQKQLDESESYILFEGAKPIKKRRKSQEDKDKEHIVPPLKPFPHPFREGDYGVGAIPKTLKELKLMAMSGSIREKPDWFNKIKDQAIVNKWKQEAKQRGLTEQDVQYVLTELASYYSPLRDGCIEVSAVDGVWMADGLIPKELKEELLSSVALLENVPDKDRDWHPGSDGQVLDLVHPSLFCYVNGVSRQVEDASLPLKWMGGGSPTVPPVRAENITTYSWKPAFITKSEKYQWLPAEFQVDSAGKVIIGSYINNLHPIQYRGMYRCLASIFEKFVPMFNKVLTDLYNPRPNRVAVDPYSWYDEEDDYDTREPREPTAPPSFIPPPAPQSVVDLRGRPLQVIVKLANIHLTPEKPHYAGGVWHVEGMENEHIVASGIYYYTSENITESALGFRQVVQEPEYEQNDNKGVSAIFGLHNDGPLNQQLGRVITKEDRCIAFPNVLQHKVAPFSLVDSTKSGYRKILVFFLVDPTHKVLSTISVPPQQRCWLMDHVSKLPPFNKLPAELTTHIFQFVDWPMSLSEAKAHQEELMKERKFFINANNEALFERPFSLCEH